MTIDPTSSPTIAEREQTLLRMLAKFADDIGRERDPVKRAHHTATYRILRKMLLEPDLDQVAKLSSQLRSHLATTKSN